MSPNAPVHAPIAALAELVFSARRRDQIKTFGRNLHRAERKTALFVEE
jgi:hypothetical protein